MLTRRPARLLRLLSLIQVAPGLEGLRAGRAARCHRPAPCATTSTDCDGWGTREAGPGRRRRLSPGAGGLAAAAAARRRRGGRRCGWSADRGERLGEGHRGGLGAGVGEAETGDPVPVAATSRPLSSDDASRSRSAGRPSTRTCWWRSRRPAGTPSALRFDYRPHAGDAPRRDGRAVPAHQRPTTLVPVRLGPGPGGLAHLPGGPDRAADTARSSVRRPAAAGRRRHRGAGRPRGAGGSLAVPGRRSSSHASAAYVRQPDADAAWRSRSSATDRCAVRVRIGRPGHARVVPRVQLDADFEVVGAPELVEAVRRVAARYQRAVEASTTS